MTVAGASTLKHRGTPGAMCAQNGWGVGTKLVGDEGYGPTVIEITAIGESNMLAKRLAHNGRAVAPIEQSWVLWCRDWREATDDDVPAPFAVGQRVRCAPHGYEGTVESGPDSRGFYIVRGVDRGWHAPGDNLEAI